MRLANIDGQKIYVVLVIVIELSNVANLATKGWSSKAAKNEYQRLTSGALSDVKTRRAVQCH